MTLEDVLRIAGWFLVLGPLSLFFFTSVYVIYNLSQEDDMILGVVMLAIALFLIGSGILALLQFTTLLV